MDDIQLVKIIVAGDSNAGKTSLLQRYCYNENDPRPQPTIGCDFANKMMTMRGTQLKLQLWDVAGQDRYQNLSKLFVRQAKGCIIMCDITSRQSLDSALNWKSAVADTSEDVPIFLVQNKTDLITSDPEQFQTSEFLNQFAQEHNFTQNFQISVKLNEKVNEIFYALVEEMINSGVLRLQESIIKSSFHLSHVPNGEKHKKKDCC